jgi:hypothetical protein
MGMHVGVYVSMNILFDSFDGRLISRVRCPITRTVCAGEDDDEAFDALRAGLGVGGVELW